MQRYFSNQKNDNFLILNDDDIYHITRVMRLKDGDKVEVVYNEELYICELITINDKLNFQIIKKEEVVIEESLDITLIIPLLQEQKIDYILQKSTELGVSTIIPYIAKRSVVKLTEEKFKKRIERWVKICKEASEQSKRLSIPRVMQLRKIDDLKNIRGLKILCSTEKGIPSIKNYLKKNSNYVKMTVVIGPEGGFDPSEEETLVNLGFNQVSLGDFILRVETVPLVIMSMINYENMEWLYVGVN